MSHCTSTTRTDGHDASTWRFHAASSRAAPPSRSRIRFELAAAGSYSSVV
jgi:hypothetical protein